MTDPFVVVHTDTSGVMFTLGGMVYTDQAVAEERVAKRRATIAERGSADRCDVYRLVPVEAVES